MANFSNDYDLNDDVDRHVAIAEASRIAAKIKVLEDDLTWFKDEFRLFYNEGKIEEGVNGATVTVAVPNNPKRHLNTKKMESNFPVSEYPLYYKEEKTRAAAVTFRK
tara:strand:- start:125 stop:445 length:321 start_codon:yes stop_codon:yes gene_type:complete